jgi:hypothetical protein
VHSRRRLGPLWGRGVVASAALFLLAGVLTGCSPGDVPVDDHDLEGVGWYVTDDQLSDLRVDITPIALTRTPYVELLVPSRYRTDGIDQALAELAPVLKEHLAKGLDCL